MALAVRATDMIPSLPDSGEMPCCGARWAVDAAAFDCRYNPRLRPSPLAAALCFSSGTSPSRSPIMLHRSLLLLSLLFAAQPQAGTASHASANGGGCPTPAIEATATASEDATTAEAATAGNDAKTAAEAPRSEPAAAPILQWRSFLPGMFK